MQTIKVGYVKLAIVVASQVYVLGFESVCACQKQIRSLYYVLCNFASMNTEKLFQIMNLVSRGDTDCVESLFRKPGGKSYLETTVLMVLSTSDYLQGEKEALFTAFLKVTGNLEKRIERQKEGEAIIMQVYL